MAKNKLKLNDPFIRNHPDPEKRIEIYDSHTAGLALRITPTGNKSFVYRYRFNDKVKRFTIGKYPAVSLAKARERIAALSYKVNNGIDPLAEKKERKSAPDPKTFKELANEFKDKHLPTLRDVTQRNYRRIIDNELIPAFGKYPIKDISKNQIISLLDGKAYKDGSPTMANRIRARLSKIFNFAIQRGLADKNPVKNTPTYKKGKTKRDRFYSEDEIRELWQIFDEWPEPTGSVLKMLLVCGQRKTETLRMKWDDIQGSEWIIPASLAKNGKEHVVPLSPMAMDIIENMKPITGESDYVFCSPKEKNAPMKWLSRVRTSIQKYSNISDFQPHDLRRTMATHMAKLGVPQNVVGKILNHKAAGGDNTVTAIYNRYNYDKERGKALNRWSSKLKQIIEGKTEAKITKIG